MERHASALKAARQAIKRRDRNRAAKSGVKTALKNFRTAIANTKPKEEAKKVLPPMLSEIQRVLMRAASKNLMKRETAYRYISRLSTAVHNATA